jgi:hypothetical protein
MNPELKMADAIRKVTAQVQRAIDDGYRSRAIDADDLVEVLLAIADGIDPPMGTLVDAGYACPNCGERREDRLVWHDAKFVRCAGCETEYVPGCPGR